ncbi:MAG TPA: type II toxin-antitoxin system RelE/ParE family toxin [Pyrinomonadaceae bacterium]|jgi:toxin ParE1/3/4|nr:type II toxin-antitoxin system RelE/ParE family toxin [Pyrinomonadaceae bacterium]
MRSVKVAAAAEEDLRTIWAYIAEHNPEAAGKVIKEIVGKFALLRDHPRIGREQDKLLLNLRSFTVKDYLIFYQPLENGVEILRVVHGSRDIESIFESFLDSL